MVAPATVGKKRRMRAEADGLEQVLVEFIKDTELTQRDILTSKSSDELLFASYAERLKALPRDMQSYVKLQMSQIFFNAENSRNIQPIDITPLPKKYSCEMNSQQPLSFEMLDSSQYTGDPVLQNNVATSDILASAMKAII